MLFKCFSCGAAGSAIDFWMLRHPSDGFVESLEGIASSMGRKVERAESTDPIALYVESARQHLGEAEPYLTARGFPMELAREWKFGVGPSTLTFAGADHLTKEMRQHLLGMRGRLIIPHMNGAKQPVGFTGRDLTGKSPSKYKISLGFSKTDRYYACHRLGVKPQWVVVVEGEIDTIMTNEYTRYVTVGASGSYSNEKQVREIPDGSVVVLIPDNDQKPNGDRPGIEAALKGSGLLQQDSRLIIKILVPPEGVDPDLWVRTDPDGMDDAIEQAPLWIDWRIEQAAASGWDSETIAFVRASISQSLPTHMRAAADEQLAASIGRDTGTPQGRKKRQRWQAANIPTPVAAYLDACVGEGVNPEQPLLEAAGVEADVEIGELVFRSSVSAARANLVSWLAAREREEPGKVQMLRRPPNLA